MGYWNIIHNAHVMAEIVIYEINVENAAHNVLKIVEEDVIAMNMNVLDAIVLVVIEIVVHYFWQCIWVCHNPCRWQYFAAMLDERDTAEQTAAVWVSIKWYIPIRPSCVPKTTPLSSIVILPQ